MNENTHSAIPSIVAEAILLGPNTPQNDGANALEVTWIECQRQMNFVTGFGHAIKAVSHMILDVA